jgi:DNA primase
MEQHIEQRITEANRRWPHITFKRKTRTEACAPCPWCGGDDRFVIFGRGNYFCRPGTGHCGRKGWIDEEDAQPLTHEEQLALRVAALERKQREQDARLRRLEEMHQCTDHLRYHQALTDQQREYWFGEGIFDDAITKHLLGYCERCPTFPASPSHTIPVFDHDGRLANIRHRLIEPDRSGKYRPHRAGLGTHLFNASILRQAQQRILVVEGSKKAIVLDQYGWPTVGILGKNVFQREWLPWFKSASQVVIALDPDAAESAQRLGAVFAQHGQHPDVRVAAFPGKPDDLIVKYGATDSDVEAILRLARPV